MSLALMKARIDITGGTLRQEQINDARDELLYDIYDDVSYNPNIVRYVPNSKLEELDSSVLVKMFDQKRSASYGFTSQFLSPYNHPIELGDILYDKKRNIGWLCVESYDIDEIHYEGKLGRCNDFLRWQENNGNIYEILGNFTNKVQYNTGVYRDEYITYGSDQIGVFTQLNKHTMKLKHGMKFMIDADKQNPTVYELSKIDTVDYSYMGKGMISLMFVEYAYAPTKKELELGICDYFNPSISSFPENKTSILSPGYNVSIAGPMNLKLGYPRTYSLRILNNAGELIDLTKLVTWSVISDYDVTLFPQENKVTVTVANEKSIGTTLLLQADLDGKIIAKQKITIVPLA